MLAEKIVDEDNIIGVNIRRLRTERNISQIQLVRLVQLQGVDLLRETLVKIEGGRQHIKLKQLHAIKKILDVTWEELMDKQNQK